MIQPTGIGSSESFGLAQLDQEITFTTPLVSGMGARTEPIASSDQFIYTTGIPSAEVFGSQIQTPVGLVSRFF
jgi:hypothetical protein